MVLRERSVSGLDRRKFLQVAGIGMAAITFPNVLARCAERERTSIRGEDIPEIHDYYPELRAHEVTSYGALKGANQEVTWVNFTDLKFNPEPLADLYSLNYKLAESKVNFFYPHPSEERDVIFVAEAMTWVKRGVFLLVSEDEPLPEVVSQSYQTPPLAVTIPGINLGTSDDFYMSIVRVPERSEPVFSVPTFDFTPETKISQELAAKLNRIMGGETSTIINQLVAVETCQATVAIQAPIEFDAIDPNVKEQLRQYILIAYLGQEVYCNTVGAVMFWKMAGLSSGEINELLGETYLAPLPPLDFDEKLIEDIYQQIPRESVVSKP